MFLTPVKTPLLVKKIFPNYTWNKSTTEKAIYLTFDDGPTPNVTNWVLRTLKEYNAKATFFCIGNNIEKHPNIFQTILNEGHTIGNHTFNHIKGWKTNLKDYLFNVKLCESELLKRTTTTNNLTIKLFRPPYGQLKSSQGKALIKLGYSIVMWDILSFDWDKNVTPKNCLNKVISNTKNGSIIVFHDSLKAKDNLMYTLPKVLEHYTQKGYSFKAIN